MELSSPSDVAATIRTTTPTPDGRAGLSYAALKPADGLTEPSYLFGLRQNDTDRSNIAVENMGIGQQGDISLRLTVFSGDAGNH